jgi:hypothetical protein
VGEWELGWLGGSELKDVRLTEGDGNVVVKCGAVHSGLTLWGVLWRDFDVGETVVEGLEVRVVKRRDGSTSVGDFLVREDGTANGMRRVLRKLRGAVEATGARVEVVSEAAGESVVYEDVGVEVGIAAAKGPVHVQVTAASAERGLTVTATVPGFGEWREGRAAAVVAGSDFEIAGTKVPTGLACDWVGMDPGWAGSLGKTVEIETLSNHASATMQAGVLTVSLRGEGGAMVEGSVLLRAATKGVPVMVVLPAAGGEGGVYRAEAALKWSGALGRMLGRVNPVFDDVRSARGLVRVTLGEMNLSPGDWSDARGAGRVVFPWMVFSQGQVFAELLRQTEFEGWSADVDVSAEALRVRLEEGHWVCEPWTLTVNGRQKMTFTGAVSVEGKVEMVARVPLAGGGRTLGTGTVEYTIVGTVEKAVVVVPK